MENELEKEHEKYIEVEKAKITVSLWVALSTVITIFSVAVSGTVVVDKIIQGQKDSRDEFTRVLMSQDKRITYLEKMDSTHTYNEIAIKDSLINQGALITIIKLQMK